MRTVKMKSSDMIDIKISNLKSLVNKINEILDNSITIDQDTIRVSKNKLLGFKKIASGVDDTFIQQIHPEEMKSPRSPIDMSLEITLKRRDGNSDIYTVQLENSDNSRGWILKSIQTNGEDMTDTYYEDDIFRNAVDKNIESELSFQ